MAILLPLLAIVSPLQAKLSAVQLFQKVRSSVMRIEASVYKEGKEMTVAGSGFLYYSDDVVVTAYHVIDKAEDIKVVDAQGRAYELNSLAFDKAADIALLYIKGHTKRKPLPSRSYADVKVGESVYAIGNSLGVLPESLSQGIVSGKRKVGGIPFVQLTAPISKGNSGGPVLDDRGRVLGVVSYFLRDAQNLNMAVSVSEASRVLYGTKKWTSPEEFTDSSFLARPNTAPSAKQEPITEAKSGSIDLNEAQAKAMGEALLRSLQKRTLLGIKKVRIRVDEPEVGQPSYDAASLSEFVELELRRSGIGAVQEKAVRFSLDPDKFPEYEFAVEIQVMRIKSVGGDDRGYCGNIVLHLTTGGYTSAWTAYGDLSLYKKSYLFTGSSDLQNQLKTNLSEMLQSFCLDWMKQNEKATN